MEKQGAVATGGMTPSNRSPVSGSSAETIGALSVTSRRTCAATRRMMRSVSAAPMCWPESARPDVARSIHRRPSGLTITSSTVGSARAAAMVGPKAVRSICRRRSWASSAAGVENEPGSGIGLLRRRRRCGTAVGLGIGGGGIAARRRPDLGQYVLADGGQQVGVVDGDRLQHLGHEPAVGREPAANLGDEDLEALLAERPGRLLLALAQRRGDRE